MKYRIKKNERLQYIPQMMDWTTLWSWIEVPDYRSAFARVMDVYTESVAKEIIELHKTRKEKIIEIE